ncbi:hypothetical protein EFK50_16930 [Nocardioides marmoriginsengisoli]|uniref:Uncharacterized protein n=1 Tax=Nocardioides marmoriginsengisoli TaxID=661483 RepID=A0A3N0CC84_9ACTN|nr:hypothetical protein [Nocardioides marmoriginsengisoli]RNL61065.1 hypothetical protein EFK50_16930 [Nocardioides marmoriginsengisoli]
MTAQRSAVEARLSLADFAPKPAARPGIWSLAQFGRVVTLWLLAFVVLAVATVGARGDANPENSGLWILLGLVGGLLGGAGTTFWLVAGTRAVRQRQQVFATRLAVLSPQLQEHLGVTGEEPVPDDTVVDPGGSTLVRLDQGTLYHRSDCLLVAGKASVVVDAVDSSLTACGVCSP